jgi:hypothetical protein
MLDMKNAKLFEKQLQSTCELLSAYKKLVGPEASEKIELILNGFQKNIKDAENQNRTLKLGVIGAMKAGKSTFLNTFIFNGEDLLPKSCIPMTAALTKISYAAKPKSVVHFYEQEDWAKIEKKARNLEEQIQAEYQAYLENWKKKHEGFSLNREFHLGGNAPQKFSQEEFRKEKLSELDDSLRAYVQLIEEVEKRKNPSLLNKLGKTDEINGCNQATLNEYVGANGEFTPIVNYIEIFSDAPILREIGIEIIDTPGLNDPISSRGEATKKFLSECDAVLLLTPCSQFMDDQTVSLMLNSLPSANIEEYLVVGSKLDAAIQDYKKSKCPFEEAYKVTVSKKIERYKEIVRQLQNKMPTNDALEKLSKKEPALLSSIFKTWSDKQNKNVPLNTEEKTLKINLANRFNFNPDAKLLNKLSGIDKIHVLINKIYENKEKIISSRNETIVSQRKHDVIITLNSIIEDTARSKRDLESADINSLKKKIEHIKYAIDSSRRKISSIFTVAANECSAQLKDLINILVSASKNHTNFSVDKKVSHDKEDRSSGLFGLIKKQVDVINITYSANTAQVINNLTLYISEIDSLLNKRLKIVIDSELLKTNVKETMKKAFNQGECPFDEDDVLCPLNEILSEIKIPPCPITPEKYIDKVKSAFPNGVAHNEDTHSLNSLQSDLISQIQGDIRQIIDSEVGKIRQILINQSENFSDNLGGKMIAHQERIESQIKKREENIALYDKFLNLLKTHIATFKGM